MRINHNITALNTYRQLTANTGATAKNIEKLSSGFRINRAGDDAAGLAISEKMRAQIRGLDQSTRNAQDGISLIQTAEGALNETHAILQRMRELADQSINGTNTDEDRQSLNNEITQLKEEINRIATTTEFNTLKLLDGTQGAKTTSADLTGGNAITVSSASKLSIVDGLETANNVIGVDLTTGGTTYHVVVKLSEGSYNDLVSFTKEFNSQLQAAAKQIDDLNFGGVATVATEAAKYTLGFDVDTTTEKVTFKITSTAAAGAGDSISISDTGTSNELKYALGIGGGPLNHAGTGAIVSTAAGAVSKDNTGLTDVNWNQFAVSLVDGLNPTANQNNQLEMKFDGLNITGYIAEGNYASASSLNTAVLNAIIGVDTSDADYTTIIGAGAQTAANWANLVNESKTYGTNNTGSAAATGLIAAIDAMTDQELNAKGYNGNSGDMKAAYFADLVSDKAGNTTLSVSLNSDNKLEISGDAEMSVVETSKAAIQLGLQNVNVDISNTGVMLQIGANAGQSLTLSIGDMRTEAIGKTTIDSTDYTLSDVDVSTKDNAQKALKILDEAIKNVSSERSKLGAVQNRLEHTINNLGTASENLTAAESRIRDVDMAKEIMEQTKNNILAQAAQAMLAQANQQPQGVLQLLR